jgi:hypothetical protein
LPAYVHWQHMEKFFIPYRAATGVGLQCDTTEISNYPICTGVSARFEHTNHDLSLSLPGQPSSATHISREELIARAVLCGGANNVRLMSIEGNSNASSNQPTPTHSLSSSSAEDERLDTIKSLIGNQGLLVKEESTTTNKPFVG